MEHYYMCSNLKIGCIFAQKKPYEGVCNYGQGDK